MIAIDGSLENWRRTGCNLTCFEMPKKEAFIDEASEVHGDDFLQLDLINKQEIENNL